MIRHSLRPGAYPHLARSARFEPVPIGAGRNPANATGSGDFWIRVALLFLILLLVSLLRAPTVNGQEQRGGREIVVDPAGPVSTIQEALDAARDGDRIVIRSGVYREGPLRVSRSVSLIGEGEPVLDGEGERPVLVVTADDVEIRGLTIRNAAVSHTHDHAAIRFEEVRGCVAADNRLEDNFFGIYLAKSRECAITGNVLRASGSRESSSANGIHLWNSKDVRIQGNRITGHRDGIYLEFVERAVVSRNVSEDNLRYGLHFMFSSELDFVANALRRNGAGVAVMYTNGVTMTGNTFEDNWGAAAYGLLLKEISDSRISGNLFLRNTVAIYSEGSGRNEFRANRFVRNGWAIRIRSNSRDNQFVDNDFVDNAFEVGADRGQHSNRFEGNYWSSYTGYDLSGDGFGDVPHRPVRLFSLIVERNPTALVLLRTFFVDVLDLTERVLPVLTPKVLIDERPRIRRVTT
jgi:nitrous oxidase accessory protein